MSRRYHRLGSAEACVPLGWSCPRWPDPWRCARWGVRGWRLLEHRSGPGQVPDARAWRPATRAFVRATLRPPVVAGWYRAATHGRVRLHAMGAATPRARCRSCNLCWSPVWLFALPLNHWLLESRSPPPSLVGPAALVTGYPVPITGTAGLRGLSRPADTGPAVAAAACWLSWLSDRWELTAGVAVRARPATAARRGDRPSCTRSRHSDQGFVPMCCPRAR